MALPPRYSTPEQDPTLYASESATHASLVSAPLTAAAAAAGPAVAAASAQAAPAVAAPSVEAAAVTAPAAPTQISGSNFVFHGTALEAAAVRVFEATGIAPFVLTGPIASGQGTVFTEAAASTVSTVQTTGGASGWYIVPSVGNDPGYVDLSTAGDTVDWSFADAGYTTGEGESAGDWFFV